METDATRMCALLVGLPDMNVLAVDDTNLVSPLRVHIETTVDTVGCASCGTRARIKERRQVALVDLAAFGRPAVLVWHKRRWLCPDEDCEVKTFTEQAPAIAAVKAKVTDRAGRWVTLQVGRHGRTVAEVADELGCDWHTVMAAVRSYGTPLIADPARIGEVTALGLDETLFARTSTRKTRSFCTSIVALDDTAQLLDVVEGRTAKTASALNSLVNFRRLRLFADMDTPFWPHQAKVGVRQTGSTSVRSSLPFLDSSEVRTGRRAQPPQTPGTDS